MKWEDISDKEAVIEWFNDPWLYDLPDIGDTPDEVEWLTAIQDVARRSGAASYVQAEYFLSMERVTAQIIENLSKLYARAYLP